MRYLSPMKLPEKDPTRCRGAQVCVWARGSCRPTRLSQTGGFSPVRTYSAQTPPAPPPPPTDPAPPDGKGGAAVVKERALAALQHAGQLGRRWGQRSARAATASADHWWGRYEEFVGINEVRGAQTQVTEAEAAFMVSRAMVREAHGGLEALQLRLKEVRDRLDRVSREEAHYLELATLEHKLLQEERRLRTAYENAEGSEREKFALFSAGVRESHEKERARAERTKNWSLVGSVLGALIGVLGSTYINRVRLQELKSLLLEAQKGPESLQEALQVQAGDHRAQQGELRALIDGLGAVLAQRGVGLQDARAPPLAPRAPPPTWPLEALKDLQVGNQKTESILETLRPQVGHLGEGLGRVEAELQAMGRLMETQEARLQEARLQEARLQEAAPVRPVGPERGDQWEPAARRLEASQRTLGEQIRTNTLYNAAFAYSAAAVTVSAVYLLTRGTG